MARSSAVVVPLADELALAVKSPLAGAAPTRRGSTPLGGVYPRWPRSGCCSASLHPSSSSFPVLFLFALLVLSLLGRVLVTLEVEDVEEG